MTIIYSKTIKVHVLATPGSGNQVARLVTLSQTASGKVLVHGCATLDLYVLAGGAAVDANVAPTVDSRSVVRSGYARVIDVASNGYVSIKVIGAVTNETCYIEEVL